jgi:hypothetical protein
MFSFALARFTLPDLAGLSGPSGAALHALESSIDQTAEFGSALTPMMKSFFL